MSERAVSEFSQFARLPRPKVTDVDIAATIAHVVSLHQSPEVEVVGTYGKLQTTRADREQLTQVLINLVQNACDAARARHGERGGVVEVRARALDDAIEVRIEDNGPGISQENRGRIFEPYFTTKSTGTGLGLAVVHRIIDDHGGSIEVLDATSGGAVFRIVLPRSGPQPGVEESRTDTVPLTARSLIREP